MSEVPDDLMKVAREVADDHDAKMKALYGPTASTRRAYMIELVAVALAAERERATLAERERCAEIAARPNLLAKWDDERATKIADLAYRTSSLAIRWPRHDPPRAEVLHCGGDRDSGVCRVADS